MADLIYIKKNLVKSETFVIADKDSVLLDMLDSLFSFTL